MCILRSPPRSVQTVERENRPTTAHERQRLMLLGLVRTKESVLLGKCLLIANDSGSMPNA